MCGEKVMEFYKLLHLLGSPPRVRGKAFQTMFGTFITGITPACAGKRQAASMPFALAPDHPRVCGEKFIFSVRRLMLIGSPPRVRGKEEENGMSILEQRITPACAGKRRPISFNSPLQ